jgi:hypothetical protein
MPRPPGIAGRATLTQSASNVQVKIRARPETFRATTSTEIPVAGIVTAANLDPPPLCKDIYSGRTLPRAEAEQFNRTSFDPGTDYDCNPHELRNPLLGASLVGTAGAVLSVMSVADAWQHRERRRSPGRRALPRERFDELASVGRTARCDV